MFSSNTTQVSGSAPDAQFNYVTMLLHGDGTNGAQNNTFVDGSTNNFSITRNGNTTQGSFSPYGSNWSNYFDGSGDYLTVPDNSAWAFGSGNFTLEAWVYRTVSGATQMIVIQSDNATAAGSAWSFYILSTNKLVANVYYGSSFITLTSSADVPANAWVHVALVRTSGTISQYINGSRDGTSASLSTNSLNDVAQTVSIGATNAGNERITGYISNLRVIKGAGPYDATSSTLTVPTTALTAITNTQLLTCADNRFIDDSANNFTITRNGDTSVQRFNPFGTSTAYSTSVIGGSGYFDGSGDYLYIPSTSAFNFGSNNFTVEFWWNTTKSGQNIINPTGTGNGWAILISGGILGWNNSYNISALFTVNATSILDNAWHHVAFVRLSGTTYVYFDGVLKTTNADPTVYTAGATDWFIGNGNIADFQGYLCDMRINNGTAVYTSAFTPPTAPLTAITNTQLLTNFTNGAIFDNAMMNDLETVGNAQISTSVKKYGTGSIAFDGTGDYLTGKTVPIGSGDLTIECWVYLNVATGDQHFVQVDGASDSNGFLSLDGGANKFRFVVRNDAGTNNISITSSISPSANTWYHIAGVVSGSNAYLFVDGSTTSGATGTLSGTRSGTGTNAYLGVNGSGGFRPLNGYLDDVRITKGYARYTANFTPPTVALSDTGPV